MITYAYLLHIPHTMTGLIAAYVVGTFPLMLVPIIVALRDLPTRLRGGGADAGREPDANLFRVELPLLGPGISAGILLTFVIVFNEFLVTLFIAGPEHDDRGAARLQPDPHGRIPAIDGGARHHDAARLVRRRAALLPVLRLALPEGDVSHLAAATATSSAIAIADSSSSTVSCS